MGKRDSWRGSMKWIQMIRRRKKEKKDGPKWRKRVDMAAMQLLLPLESIFHPLSEQEAPLQVRAWRNEKGVAWEAIVIKIQFVSRTYRKTLQKPIFKIYFLTLGELVVYISPKTRKHYNLVALLLSLLYIENTLHLLWKNFRDLVMII